MKLNLDRRTAVALQAVLAAAQAPDLDDLKGQVDKIVARPPDDATFLTVTDLDALLDVLPQALPASPANDNANQHQVRVSAMPKMRRKVEQIRAGDRARGLVREPSHLAVKRQRPI